MVFGQPFEIKHTWAEADCWQSIKMEGIYEPTQT